MPWFVARTKLGKERQAATTLAQQGIEVYAPVLYKQKSRAGRRDWEPLFPCYLFASLEIPSDQWLAARSAHDVAYFLGDAGQPTALPDEFIAALTLRVDLANRRGGPPRFQSGDRVIIADGPFQFMEAIFDRSLSPSGRSRVLVQLLNRLVPVELSEAHLQKVG
jgi:transcription elongation factor/antiterminator RfaH